jgi:hypothetical protein
MSLINDMPSMTWRKEIITSLKEGRLIDMQSVLDTKR